MGQQPLKHDRSHGKVDAWVTPKRTRSSQRPSAPLKELATPLRPPPLPPSRGVTMRHPRRGNPRRPASPVHAATPPAATSGRKNQMADSTKAMLQQDDYEKREYSPGVVLSKSGDSAVKMASAYVDDLPAEDLRDNEVITVDSEGPSKPLPSISLVQDEEAVRLARTFVNEQVKEFMEGVSEPGILQSRLSKITSFLVQATSIAAVLHDEIPRQIRAQSALVTQVSELEKQVEELSKKLCSTEEELEGTNALLKETQAAMLEAQSDRATTVAAMNSLAMRMGASFARLGTILDPPPNVVDSLEESIKQMTALVSLLVPVSHSHGSSLARSSLTSGVAALLCRGRGIKSLREPSGMDTRQFVRSQGPEFHSLISQVVDSMEQRLAKTLEGGGWRDSRATEESGKPTNNNKGTMPELH